MSGSEQVQAGIVVDQFHIQLHGSSACRHFAPLLQRYAGDIVLQFGKAFSGIIKGNKFWCSATYGAEKSAVRQDYHFGTLLARRRTAAFYDRNQQSQLILAAQFVKFAYPVPHVISLPPLPAPASP